MILLLQNRKYPLRFLLYFEWFLLGIIICSEVLSSWFSLASRLPRMPLINLFCLLIFGIIGLKLPSKNRQNKIIYTGFEFILIILASMVGGILVVPLLYLVLIARNCLIFEGVTRSIVSSLAMIFALVTQLYRAKYINMVQPLAINQQLGLVLLVSVLILGISTVFMQMAVNAIVQEFESRQKLAVANAQLREYALKIEELATVQERNRIARDIHDSVGHALTVSNLHLEAALKLWKTDPEEATEFLMEAKQLGSNALKEVRQSIATLRFDPLVGLSLSEAIANLVKEFKRSSGILTILEINLQSTVKNEIKVAIYRIIQESLTNICKHASATEVTISLQTTTDIILIIQDNGKGFKINKNTTGFGLQSMCDRTLAIGGNLNIETTPNGGCKIIVTVPLN
ncbi:sensor histidine kinase [Plectonema cf. radiosum LEGE 06105]|uniref:histidine kinase n=1 Tax=Plectonema cf. radiosum LEGE 06105 TaxID=945769 RepID=A0A8J7FAV4_9CYAN|nr:sensor histidine kinase [Plectonema radiosum]MBE9214924.1 sensor histidine kinase [Plectonema cf. radiosum LEGE 06105]